MIVCVCSNVSSTSINLIIEQFWSEGVKEQDIAPRVMKELGIGDKCGNCQIFINQIVRDALDYKYAGGV